MVEKLDRATVQSKIKDLTGWMLADDRDAILKTYRFKDFGAAFAFMTRTAILADKMNHHA
jgi:4a-hydroxytetrahydrobiopterin dehydratase